MPLIRLAQFASDANGVPQVTFDLEYQQKRVIRIIGANNTASYARGRLPDYIDPATGQPYKMDVAPFSTNQINIPRPAQEAVNLVIDAQGNIQDGPSFDFQYPYFPVAGDEPV